MVVPEQTLFFANGEDLRTGFERLEAFVSLHYFRAGLFEVAEPESYSTALDFPHLGILEGGARPQKPRFLVLKSNLAVEVRCVPQRRGGARYAIDTLANPAGVIVELGGTTGNVLVPGSVAGGRSATVLRRAFDKHFFQGFKPRRAFLVGPAAWRMWEEGVRLTPSPAADLSMDLA